jgi:uncharacterized C2H2 Zn-finger protein
MLYECPRCHYSSENKCHYIKHLRKQKECLPTFSDKPSVQILEELIDEKNSLRAFKCDNCTKSFAQKKNLSKHIKDTHITINNTTNDNSTHTDNHNINNSHHNDNSTVNDNSTHIDNSTHYNISPNITIELRPFGKERMDYILENKEIMTKFLMSALTTGLPKMFQNIHMNDNVPENQNVKHKSSKYPAKVNVYMKEEGMDKAEWVAKHTSDIVEMAMRDMVNYLHKHKNDLYSEIENPSRDDEELFFERHEKLCNIRNKEKRGVFAPIRNNIALILKEQQNITTETAETAETAET